MKFDAERLEERLEELTRREYAAKRTQHPSPEFLDFCMKLQPILTTDAITLLWILKGNEALKK